LSNLPARLLVGLQEPEEAVVLVASHGTNRRGEIMTSTRDGQKNRCAVITGAGSGLGRDIALGLAAKGYRVFGTAISADEIADLKRASDGAGKLSQCDITNEASVKAWASDVTIQDDSGIDLLISNAGILTPG